jgi:hypothetical protein
MNQTSFRSLFGPFALAVDDDFPFFSRLARSLSPQPPPLFYLKVMTTMRRQKVRREIAIIDSLRIFFTYSCIHFHFSRISQNHLRLTHGSIACSTSPEPFHFPVCLCENFFPFILSLSLNFFIGDDFNVMKHLPFFFSLLALSQGNHFVERERVRVRCMNLM